MNLGRLRLVTFDVTNTLLKFRSAPGQQYGEIGAMYGILCDNNSLGANFKAHWRKMNLEHPNFGRHSGLGWEKWWQMIVHGTFKDSKFDLDDRKLDAIATHLIDVYKTSACWQQCYGVQELLSFIRKKTIPMGIISNFDPRLGATLINTKLRHYFDFVITSYEVGFEKPDPKIFEEAMSQSKLRNLSPEECLHIGDTAILDYYGAKEAGWHGALIDDRNPDEIKIKYPEVDVRNIYPSLYHMYIYFVGANKEQLKVKVQ